MSTASPGRRMRVAASSLDQVFSSTSNGLILFAIAVVSTPESFGRIALLVTALMAVVGAQRGAFGTSLLLKSDQSIDEIRREGGYALTAAVVVGVAVAMLVLALGWAVGLPAILLAVGAPIVLCQDVLRIIAIAGGQPHVAAIWDGIWFAGSLLLLACSWFANPTASALIGGWAALGLLALVGMFVNLRVTPRWEGIAGWLRSSLGHRVRYGVDAGLEQATVFTVLAIVTAILGSPATAALRGATVLLAPVGILASASAMIVISESTRAAAQPARVWRSLLTSTALMGVAATLVGGAFYAMPAGVGHFVLGESFSSAQHILPVVAIEYACSAMIFAIATFLRSFNRSTGLVRFKIGTTVAAVAGATLGAMLFGSAMGVAVGLATGTILAGSAGLAIYTPWATRERVG